VLSEAAHSFLDLAATVFTYFAVRISGKPADQEHQYGHGKIESMAALAETALLFVLSALVILKAAERLVGGATGAVEVGLATFAVMVVSIGVDFFRARVLSRVAQQTSSQALEADALHFGSDMWSSLAVLVGLGGVALGFPRADAVAAGVVGVFVCLAGWRLGKRTIDTLTDVAPAGVAEQVTARPARCCSSMLPLRSAARCRSNGWRALRPTLSAPFALKLSKPRSPSPAVPSRSTTKPCSSASWSSPAIADWACTT
jgi:cation diffusion facilitator family transporter